MRYGTTPSPHAINRAPSNSRTTTDITTCDADIAHQTVSATKNNCIHILHTIVHMVKTSISANADGPRDTASRKMANTTLHANWNHQTATLRALFKAHCYTDHHLSVISTHIHSRPKLHLVNLLLTYYASKFATNTQEIKPMELKPYCIDSTVAKRNSSPSSLTLLISVNGCCGIIFLSP